MKSRTLLHLSGLAAVCIAFGAGRFSREPAITRPPTPGSNTGENRAADDTDETTRDAAATGFGSGLLDHQVVRNRIREIFSKGTDFECCKLACALIPGITAENWRAVFESLPPAKDARGHALSRNAVAYHLLLERIGAVGGVTLMEERLHQAGTDTEMLSYLMRGWSEKSPQNATDWCRQLSPPNQEMVIADLISGVAHNDPTQALGLITMDKQFQSDEASGNLIRETIQAGGFRLAEELVNSLDGRKDIPQPLQGKLFSTLASREVELNGNAGTPAAGLAWLEQFVGHEFLGPMSTSVLVSQAASADPAKTLAWLQENAPRMTDKQKNVSYPILSRLWEQQSAEQFAGWLSANPESPMRDPLAAATAQRLLAAGKIDDAQRWLQFIGDPTLRAATAATKSANLLPGDSF